jgi:hypothetical protein
MPNIVRLRSALSGLFTSFAPAPAGGVTRNFTSFPHNAAPHWYTSTTPSLLCVIQRPEIGAAACAGIAAHIAAAIIHVLAWCILGPLR